MKKMVLSCDDDFDYIITVLLIVVIIVSTSLFLYFGTKNNAILGVQTVLLIIISLYTTKNYFELKRL